MNFPPPPPKKKASTLHVFVFDSENYMENMFGNYLVAQSHFGYIK